MLSSPSELQIIEPASDTPAQTRKTLAVLETTQSSSSLRRVLTSKPAFFAYALLLHLVVFALIAHIKFAQPIQQASMPDGPDFQIVKIAPPKPPPPPLAPPPPILNLAGAGGATGPASTVIVTPQMPAFTIPNPTVDLPLPAIFVPKPTTAPTVAMLPQGGTGQGDGTGTTGNGAGNTRGNGEGDGTGTANIAGLPIDNTQVLVVAIDVSVSMTDVNNILVPLIKRNLSKATIVNCQGCRGHILPNESIADNDPILQEKGHESDKQGHRFALTTDIYYDVFNGLNPDNGNIDPNKPPTAVLLISDFEDGDDAAASEAFVDFLRDHLMRLYVYSVEKAPYGPLARYAQMSGGQVFITTKDTVNPNTPKNHK